MHLYAVVTRHVCHFGEVTLTVELTPSIFWMHRKRYGMQSVTSGTVKHILWCGESAKILSSHLGADVMFFLLRDVLTALLMRITVQISTTTASYTVDDYI